MLKYNSNEEQDFTKIHTNHLLDKYKTVSLNNTIFPKELTQLYKVKFFQACKKNKIVLPEEIRGRDLGKIRKVSKWDNKHKKEKLSDDYMRQNSGTFSCNNCFKYMVPGQTVEIQLNKDNELVYKCTYCKYELKQNIKVPEFKSASKPKAQDKQNKDNNNNMSKKQKQKNKNKLIIQQRMKQNQNTKSSSSSSLNLMDFLK